MSKHTPGPWRSHTNGSDFFVTATDFHGANGKVAKCYVADVQKFRNESGEDECQANAKLIAAAPDMLEALKGILNSFHESVKTTASLDEFPSLKAVQAAIAKAQGTTE